ncbi:MAG: hypothetical protein AAFY76_00980 [Cyanobacteria bacterium J06649_11]
MTEKPKKKFDPVTDPREWSAASTEEGCKKLAKAKGKKLVEIIRDESKELPIICIFEDDPDA